MPCSFPDCGRLVHCRGWCSSHHGQWLAGRALTPVQPKLTLAERFWKYVAKSDGCWEWIGHRQGAGYGRIGLGDKVKLGAHRVSWELHNGPIPDGLWVLHRCDNPPCVRPDHLFLGTNADNVADMIAKGRVRHAGECNGRARLTADKVREIRVRLARGERKVDIAPDYGVRPSAISSVATGRTWGHVT